LDDLFLGIGAAIMLQTFIVGTILYGWVVELNQALERDDFAYILDNDHRIVKFWYSTSATYIFSVVMPPPINSFLLVRDVDWIVVYKIGDCLVFMSLVE
jgi:hypothetical protein